MRQIETLQLSSENLTIIFLAFCLTFMIKSQGVKAQSGSGRTASAAARKKVSKPVKIDSPKPVKKTFPKASKAPVAKIVEPKKAAERPRQVVLPAEDRKRTTAVKPALEEPIKEVVQQQREVERINNRVAPFRPELRRVVLQGKREVANGELLTSVPMAKIERVKIYQNVYEDDVRGIRVHVKFRTLNLEQNDAKLAAYFYLLNNDASFTGEVKKYSAKTNAPFVEETFMSSSKESIFSDYTLFMPYSELKRIYNTDSGNSAFKVKMQIQVAELDGGLLAASGYSYLNVD